MKVWQVIANGVKWDITCEHVEKTFKSLNITPCEVEDAIPILGHKLICSNKCEICLSAYLQKDVNEKTKQHITEGQLCLF